MSKIVNWADLESDFGEDRLEAASDGYSEALAQHPDSALARLRLGQCHAGAGRFAEADRYWGEALQVLQSRPDALERELTRHFGEEMRPGDVLPYGDKFPAGSQLLLLLADSYEQQDAISAAISAVTEILENDPRCGEAYRRLSHLAWRNGDTAEAVELAHSAILVDPAGGGQMALVCGHLVEQDRHDEAVVLGELVLAHGKDAPEVRNELGKLFLVKAKLSGLRREFLDKATDHLQRSLELDDDQPDVRALMETVKRFLERRAAVGASSIRRDVSVLPEEAQAAARLSGSDSSVGASSWRRVAVVSSDTDPGSGSGVAAPMESAPADETLADRKSPPSDAEGDPGEGDPTSPSTVKIASPFARTARLSRKDWNEVESPTRLAPTGRSGAISEMPD